MKELRNLYIALFIVGWIIYILLTWLLSQSIGKSIDFISITVGGLMVSGLTSWMSFMLVKSLLKPKLDFLNSETSKIPTFEDKIEKTLYIERTDFSFEVLKYKIGQHYQMTVYDDIEKYILKFYTGIKLLSWGTGGCIVFNAVSKEITVTCFPFSGHNEKAVKATERVMKKTEKIILTK